MRKCGCQLLWVVLLPPAAQAATFTWTGGGSSASWYFKTNWVVTDANLNGRTDDEDSDGRPDSNDDIVFYRDPKLLKTELSTDVDNRTIRSLTFADSATESVTIAAAASSGAKLTITASEAQAGIDVRPLSGSHEIKAGVILGNSQTWNIDGGQFTVSGEISGASNGITKSGAGTLVLSGTNSFTGAAIVDSGTLKLNAANSLDSGCALVVNGTGKVILNGQEEMLGDVTLNGGSIAGGSLRGRSYSVRSGAIDAVLAERSAGAMTQLTKSTAGTVTLTGTNTYYGATTISEGILIVNGSITNSVTDVNTGTLAGKGITANVNLYGGGRIAPGTGDDATEKLTVKDLMFDGSGSSYEATIGSLGLSGASAPLATPGDSDLLHAETVSGSITIDLVSELSAPQNGYIYRWLIANVQTWNPTGEVLINNPWGVDSAKFSILKTEDSTGRTDVSVVYTHASVPEATTVLLAAVGLVPALLHRRRI